MSVIIGFKTENTKRISVVEITPQGNVVVLGGKNGAGKSSVLDGLEWALDGDPSAKMPVRKGQEKSRTIVTIGEPGKPELIVRRVFTAAGGTSLVVTNADGAKQLSPQAILDKLQCKLTFDPLAFATQKPDEQAKTLRALIGLDFTAHDAKYSTIYDERTAVNRDVKSLENQIAAAPKYDGVPDVESSAADILAEQQKASETNASNHEERGKLNNVSESLDLIQGDMEASEKQIKSLEKQLADERERFESLRSQQGQLGTKYSNLKVVVQELVDVPLDGFRERIEKVEEDNRKIRSNKNRAGLVEKLLSKREEAENLTSRLEKMDANKRDATTKARYPVPGLLFDASGGIVLDGIPFEQCNSAAQLRVSVAIGFALNPKLRILMVRNGSLLDDDSMKILEQMAIEAKAQIWMERVGTDAHTSVVIEDGHVQGVEPVPEPVSDFPQRAEDAPESDAPTPAPAPEPPPVKKPSKLKRGQESLL